MPIAKIHIIEGRTEEQRRALVEKVTDAICESLDVPPEKVRIIIEDMAKHNYGVGGQLVKDKE